MRAVRREDVPAEDDAHVALLVDERVAEHLPVRLLVQSCVALEWMPEDVHGVRVFALDSVCESDRSREVECGSDRPWKPERAHYRKVSV